jgi:hypothetical protein
MLAIAGMVYFTEALMLIWIVTKKVGYLVALEEFIGSVCCAVLGTREANIYHSGLAFLVTKFLFLNFIS